MKRVKQRIFSGVVCEQEVYTVADRQMRQRRHPTGRLRAGARESVGAVRREHECMNKAVMLSIKPKWCVRIAIGEKTIEVRKTRPKIEPPFKCYIYCTVRHSRAPWGYTQAVIDDLWRLRSGKCVYKPDAEKEDFYEAQRLNGMVIGELVCDWIRDILVFPSGHIPPYIAEEAYLIDSGLSRKEIALYIGNGKDGYAWHISDLVIYDTPRPLSDFGLKRPPQSWCYVKEK